MHDRRSGRWYSAGSWIGGRTTATARGLALGALTPVGVAFLLALGRALAFGRPGHGSSAPGTFLLQSVLLVALAICLVLLVLLFVPGAPAALRALANLNRRLIESWCGVPVAVPYLPPPTRQKADRIGYLRRLRWLLTDPATWRDLLWLGAASVAGTVVAALPAALVLYGLSALLIQIGRSTGPGWPVVPATATVATGLLTAPWLLAAYGGLARSLLAPSGHAELARRVRHLAQTRAEAVDAGAEELRRIERDLHDGAQARLVAMGMTLAAASAIIDTNPHAAKTLLAEAGDHSARALQELRALVRGIHPPVLADRGLTDAIRALVLDTPLRIQLDGDLNGRPPAPVESAAYFAVSELLANVSKHAQATQAWIDIRHTDGTLRLGVTDNGRGGADPTGGTGLHGIERRLAALDGILAISSPPGGPTSVAMEIPCELS